MELSETDSLDGILEPNFGFNDDDESRFDSMEEPGVSRDMRLWNMDTIREELDEFAEVQSGISECLYFLAKARELCEDFNSYRNSELKELEKVKQAVRSLEKLVDTRIQRDMEFLMEQYESEWQQQNQKDKRYKNLVSRAMQHLNETQTTIAELDDSILKCADRMQVLKQEIVQMNALSTGQKTELEELKEVTRNGVTHKEFYEKKQKIQRLHEEIVQMQEDKNRVMHKVERTSLMDDSGSENEDASESNQEIFFLRKTLEQLQSLRDSAKLEFDTYTKTAEAEVSQLQQCCECLINFIDQEKGAGSMELELD